MSVMGGAPLEEVYINDDTLWSGSEEFYLNPQHYDKFEEARRLSLEGKVKEANISLIMIWKGAGLKRICLWQACI